MGCIICGDNVKERKFFGNLAKCDKCGLVYFNSQKNIIPSDLYGENYFLGDEYLNYKNDRAILQKNFIVRLQNVCQYIKRGKMFEIGCAYGFFLDVAKKFFSVEGIDVCNEPTTFARNVLKLNVKTGDYTKFKLKELKDVFCMWDTIEHLERPDLFLKKIRSELTDGGYLFLTTGDIGSVLAKIRGRKWRIIHPPTHLYYFSSDTITKLLNHCGFEIIKITHPGVYRSFKQIVYSIFFLGKKKISGNFFNKLDFPIYMNTFDIMLIIAKKI